MILFFHVPWLGPKQSTKSPQTIRVSDLYHYFIKMPNFLRRIQRWLQDDINLGSHGFTGCLHTYKARRKAFARDLDAVISCNMNYNSRWQHHFISWFSVCRRLTECLNKGQSKGSVTDSSHQTKASATWLSKPHSQIFETPLVVIEEVTLLLSAIRTRTAQ